MINFQASSLSTVTPEGMLTLWGTFDHFRKYIYDNYGWKQIDTQENHEARIRKIIQRAIPDHNTTSIDKYPADFPQTIRSAMKDLGKEKNMGNYDDDTLNQFEYLIRYILETADAHFLRNLDGTANSTTSKTGILLGHSDMPAVRHFLIPDEELAILKRIIPQLPYSGEARLILLQMASGERENECCGANWSMLERDPSTGVCKLVMPQSTVVGGSKLKLGGKSENAPRIIVISEFAFTLLMDAKAKLLNQWLASNHTKESFSNAPIGCQGNLLDKRCSTKHMTDYANHLFAQIGIRRNELSALSTELVAIYQEKRDAGLYVDINDYRSPTCYLLRRSDATHMVAQGYSASDRQYSFGHRIDDPTVDRRIYSEELKQIEISEKASTRPLLNPLKSKEYRLKPSDTVSVRGHEEVIIIEPDATSILLQVEADEPGDVIEVTIEQIGDAPYGYQLITHQIPLDPDINATQYPTEINILGFYHKLYAKQIDDFQQWLSNFFGEQSHTII